MGKKHAEFMRRVTAILMAFLMLPFASFSAFADSSAVRTVRDTQIGGERSSLFSYDWKFKLTGDDCSAVDFDDSSWEIVDVPHDWKISGNVDRSNLYSAETGWYRKTLYLPEEDSGREISLRFDGVQKNTTVYVNGQYAGYYPAGYSSFNIDITELLNFGNIPNTIAVKVDYKYQDAWWYTGAGILRDVWLTVTDKLCVNYLGTYIYTDGVSEATIETEVKNNYDTQKTAIVKQTVLDADGQVVASTESESITVEAGAIVTDIQTVSVPEARLWDLDDPYLYTMKTEIISDGETVDTYTGTFGFRSVVADPENGLYINGKHTRINGVCLHADLGALGGVTNYAGIKKRFEKLKEMGVNAIRTAHNQCDPIWIQLCDEMGLMVYDEGIVRWDECSYFHELADQDLSCSPNSSPIGELKWSEVELRNWIRRDRNHPSVMFWSFGNEVPSATTESGRANGKWLARLCKTEDPQSNALVGFASNSAGTASMAVECCDFMAFNYGYSDDGYFFDEMHAKHPNIPIMQAESLSVTSSRGIYHTPADELVRTHPDNQGSSYGNSSVGWGMPAEEGWVYVRDQHSLGQFIWTGYDYIGEPTPYQTKNSYFGFIDTAGLEKDDFYLYQSLWTEEPMVHLLPYWDDSIGDTIAVYAYSNAPSVELFFKAEGSDTEESLGKKYVNLETDEVLHYEWDVPYADGTVIARAYDEDDNLIATDEITSFGDPAAVVIEADRTEITADGRDLVYVTASMVDENGNFVANARNSVKFTVTGAGRLVGVDNGDSTDYDKYIDTERNAFSGKVVAIIMSDGTEGDIIIEADSYGIDSAAPITVRAVHEQEITDITLGSIDGSSEITADGGTLKMTSSVEPASADYPRVKYSVSDSSVAYIDEYGVLKALADGIVQVSATALDGSGVSDTRTIEISGQTEDVKVTDITLSVDDSITVKSGTLDMSASITPADATLQRINWSVSNDCAEIDESGKLTARYNGRVTVIAEAADGSGVYAQKTIEISGQEENYIPVTKVALEVIEGSTTLSGDSLAATVKANLFPENNSLPLDEIVWSIEGTAGAISSDNGDGTVEIKAQGGGDFTLKATVRNTSDYPQAIAEKTFTVTDLSTYVRNPYNTVYARDYDDKTNNPVAAGDIYDQHLSNIYSDDYIGFKNIDFGSVGTKSITINAIITSSLASITVRKDSPNGEVLGQMYVKNGSKNRKDYTLELDEVLTGVHDIYFGIRAFGGTSGMYSFRFNEIEVEDSFNPYLKINAADYSSCYGLGAISGTSVSNIASGTSLTYKSAAFGGIGSEKLKINAAAKSNVGIKIYDGSSYGKLLASIVFPASGGLDTFAEHSFDIPLVFANRDLCFVFEGEITLGSFRFIYSERSPFDIIEAEDADEKSAGHGGDLEIVADADTTAIHCIGNDSLIFNDVDFGNMSASILKARVKSSSDTSALWLTIDNSTTIKFDEERLLSGDEYEEYTFDITPITGTHDLMFSFPLGTDILFDSFVFADGGVTPVENVFLNKYATASSTLTERYPENATNTDETLKWCASDDTYPQWLQVDLGSRYQIYDMKLLLADETSAFKYYVSVSDDADSWTEDNIIVDKSTDATADTVREFDINATGRYVRITFTENVGDKIATVVGISGSGMTYNLAYNKSASATSSQGTTQGPHLANNDILYVRDSLKNQWCADGPTSASWQVDLGREHNIGEVEVTMEANVPYVYTLQGSLNGTDWFDIEYVEAKKVSTVLQDFTARYLRVKDLVSLNSGAWPAIVNFVAYKSDAEVPQGISLDKYELELDIDASETLTASVDSGNAANTAVAWYSSDPEVVSVSSDGTVTGISNGYATVTAITVSGAKTAVCGVVVGTGAKDEVEKDETDMTPDVLFTADEMDIKATGGYILGDLVDQGAFKYRNVTFQNGTSEDGSRVTMYFPVDGFPTDFSLVESRYVKVGYRALIDDSNRSCQVDPMPYNEGYSTRLWDSVNPAISTDGSCWDSFVIDMSTYTGGENLVVAAGEENFFEGNCSGIMNALPMKIQGGVGYEMFEGNYFDVLYVAFFDNEEAANKYDFFESVGAKSTVTYVLDGNVLKTDEVISGSALEYPDFRIPAGYIIESWSVDEGTVINEDTTVVASFSRPDYILYGDVNGDSSVGPNDAVILARYNASWMDYDSMVVNLTAADVDTDGVVGPSDVVILTRHLSAWSNYETLPFKRSID